MDNKRQLLSLSNLYLYFSIYANENQIACISKQRVLCHLCLILNNFYILWRSKYNTENGLRYSSQVEIILFSLNASIKWWESGMICFLANIKVHLEGKLMIRKPVNFTYRMLTWLRLKSCSLNRRISKDNYLLEFCLTGAAQPFVDVKRWPLAARPKAVLAGSQHCILLVAEPSLTVPRKNLLAKAFMKLMFCKPQGNRSPPCSVGIATVKLVSSMAPPTSPRAGGSVPISLPDHIFSLGAQHSLRVCLCPFCFAL